MTNTAAMLCFLGVTVHFLLENNLQALTIVVFELDKSHTGEYRGQQLTEILKNWGIESDKVVPFVTDSGANMIKSIR